MYNVHLTFCANVKYDETNPSQYAIYIYISDFQL